MVKNHEKNHEKIRPLEREKNHESKNEKLILLEYETKIIHEMIIHHDDEISVYQKTKIHQKTNIRETRIKFQINLENLKLHENETKIRKKIPGRISSMMGRWIMG